MSQFSGVACQDGARGGCWQFPDNGARSSVDQGKIDEKRSSVAKMRPFFELKQAAPGQFATLPPRYAIEPTYNCLGLVPQCRSMNTPRFKLLNFFLSLSLVAISNRVDCSNFGNLSGNDDHRQ